MATDQDRFGGLAPGAGLVTYEADWFSGSQIQVMIGDVLVDNAISIGYDLVADRRPVFGFGSEYFSFTVKTPVIIRGQVSIAYKESFYMLQPAARFHNRAIKDNGSLTTARMSKGRASGFKSLDAASRAARNGYVKYRNIENLYEHFKQQRDLGVSADAGLVKQLAALDDSTWENLAERFEDAIWYGSDRQSPVSRGELFSETMGEDHGQITMKDLMSHRRLDQYPAVDIWITYGDMEAPNTVNHTVEKLLDVYFTGETKQINVGGEPVIVSYSFVARNRV